MDDTWEDEESDVCMDTDDDEGSEDEESSSGYEDSQAEEVDDEDIEEEEEEVLEESVDWVAGQDESSDEEEVEEVEVMSSPQRSKVRGMQSSSSEEEDEPDVNEQDRSSPIMRTKKSAKKMIFSSEEDDEIVNNDERGRDSCTICLLPMREQELGRPDACEHLFCAECIVEWSRNVATCPIDRRPMRSIVVTLGGQEVRRQRVSVRRLREVEEELAAEEPLFDMDCFCEACGAGDREDRLLLCDGCDLGHHMECLSPPLQAIPRGRWYCPTCEAAGVGTARRNAEVSRRRVRRRSTPRRPRRIRDDDDEEEEEEHAGVDEDGEVDETLGGFIVPDAEVEDCFDSDSDFEAVPRTLQTSRIERTVRNRRRSAAAAAGNSAAKKSPAKKRKKKTVKKKTKRKVTKRRKKTTTKTTKTKDGKTVRKKKTTKRKTKKKTVRKTKKKVTKGKGKGKGKGKSSSKEEKVLKKDLGPSLSLFGDKNDLDFYGDDEMLYANPAPGPSGLVMDRDKAKSIVSGEGSSQQSSLTRSVSTTSSSSSSQDLLSDIMNSQKRTLSPVKNVATDKHREVYRKSEESKPLSSSTPKLISTSVSQYSHRQEQLRKDEELRERRKQKTEKAEEEDVRNFKKSLSYDQVFKPPTKVNLEKNCTGSIKSSEKINKSLSLNLKSQSSSTDRAKRKLEGSSDESSSLSKKPKHSYTTTSTPPSTSSSFSPTSSSDSKPSLSDKVAKIMLEVKRHLKPAYSSGKISGNSYKKILSKAVEKIYRKCKDDPARQMHPEKVKKLVDAYVLIYAE